MIKDLKAEKNEEKDECEKGLEIPASHLPSQKLERVKPSTKETSKMAYLPDVSLTKQGQTGLLNPRFQCHLPIIMRLSLTFCN